MRINAVLPEDMIEKLDSIAKDEKKSRSLLLREAAERLISEHQRLIAERRRRERIRRAIDTQDRLRKVSGKWDGVAEVRKWRETAK